MLVHPKLAAAGCCPPVHVSDPVSRDELPDVGELDPLRLLARHVVSREDLCLSRPEQAAHCLLRGVHLERLAAIDHLLVLEQAEGIVRAEVNPTHSGRAPSDAAQAQLQHALVTLAEPQSGRVGPFYDLETRRKIEEYVDTLGRVARVEPDRDVEQVAFEGPLVSELDFQVDAWRAHLERADCYDERKRRRKENELRQPERERGEQSECSKSGVSA